MSGRFFTENPAPIMAHALDCSISAGIPIRVQSVTTAEAAALAALYEGASRSQSSKPTFFITFDAPNIVPTVRAAAHKSSTDMGTSGSRIVF